VGGVKVGLSWFMFYVAPWFMFYVAPWFMFYAAPWLTLVSLHWRVHTFEAHTVGTLLVCVFALEGTARPHRS
jgi:hypothetical protein